MKSAFECYQEAAKCEEKAKVALTKEDREFLLDAAHHWRQSGEEAAETEAATLAADIHRASS